MVKTNTKFKETELGPIPEEWDVLAVNHIADVVGGGTPSTKSAENFGGEIPWITPRDLSNFRDRFIERGERNISKLGLNSSNARLLPKGTVLLSSRAPVGYLAIAAKEVTTNQGFQSLVPNEKVDNIFLYYLLKNNTQRLIDNASGSTFQELSGKTLKSMIFAFPKIKEQKSISSILSSLDDKIELNRQINANLEKIASTLFKRWFVDFEFPDKNGKPYKSSGGKMVESEMGEIPEGWRVSRIGDEFTIIMGQSPSGETYNELGNGMPFYQGRTDFGFRFPSRRIFCTGPTRTAKSLDTLISVRAPVGDVNMASEDCCIGRGVGAIRKTGYSSYVFYTIKSLQDEITQFDSEGTVFGSINKESLSNITFIAPQADLVVEFETIAGCIDGQIMNLTQEMGRLVNTRDLLLPRLMNGKLRTE